MSKRTDPYTFDQIATLFVNKAANYAGYRYRFYSVEADEVASEIYVWLYGEGKAKVERWLANDPQQTTRIYRSMLDIAIAFGEREKAAQLGYETDDVMWYTRSLVEGLLPLALDADFDGIGSGSPAHETGNLHAMVVDIRKAIKGDLESYFLEANPDDVLWEENVRTVLDRLGGIRPFVGRRKVMSNAQAQAITREQW